MSEHTLGPWRVGNRTGHNVNLVFAPDNEAVATVFGLPLNCSVDEVSNSPKWQRGLSDARLIAAAPDLLESLKEAVELMEWQVKGDDPTWDGTVTPTSVMGRARAVIARATGGA